MFHIFLLLCSTILAASAQNYLPTYGHIPYGYGYPFYRQFPPPYVQPYMHSVDLQYGSGPPDTYYGNNHQEEIIDVSPEVFRAEMRKLGVLQETLHADVNNIQPQVNYADYQITPNNPQLSYPSFAAVPHYQPTQYIQSPPAQLYSNVRPYGEPESSTAPQMVYIPVNTSTQDIQVPRQPSFSYAQNGYQQVPAQIYKPSIGHMQTEFTYIPTYQHKNPSPSPILKKRRNRHRYVVKKESSQNNGNQSESRVIDKHEVQRKTYTFRKTFVVTPEKRPSGPITINLVNGVPITTGAPEETTVTSIPTTTTEDNEVPEDTTGFANFFKLK